MFMRGWGEIICNPGKVWIFHSGKKDQAVCGHCWDLLMSSRHTHGSQKDKGKAGGQRLIKKGQREREH